MELIDRICEEGMAALGPKYSGDSVLSVYANAICAFYYFLNVGGFGQFLLDILSSRELTDKLIDMQRKWMRNLGTEEVDAQDVDRVLTMTIGGFNELAYAQLSATGTFDVFDLVGFTINATHALYRRNAAGEMIDLPKDDEFASKIEEACARIRL